MVELTNERTNKQDHQALLKAKYCPRTEAGNVLPSVIQET